MNKPTHKAIHIAKLCKAYRKSQNLSISMSLPTLRNMLTKFKELNRMKEELGTKLCIRNGGQNAINETNMNKINGGAKMKVSEDNPTTAHTRDR